MRSGESRVVWSGTDNDGLEASVTLHPSGAVEFCSSMDSDLTANEAYAVAIVALAADRDRLQRERDDLAARVVWLEHAYAGIVEAEREDNQDREIGDLVLEVLRAERANSVDVGSRWYGMKIDVLREKEARGDGINVYSVGGNYPKTDTAPLIEALRAALQAAPTGGAAPLKGGG